MFRMLKVFLEVPSRSQEESESKVTDYLRILLVVKYREYNGSALLVYSLQATPIVPWIPSDRSGCGPGCVIFYETQANY